MLVKTGAEGKLIETSLWMLRKLSIKKVFKRTMWAWNSVQSLVIQRNRNIRKNIAHGKKCAKVGSSNRDKMILRHQ